VNDPVTSLILGGAYCSNGKEVQWRFMGYLLCEISIQITAARAST
jgi:hypothetical protein